MVGDYVRDWFIQCQSEGVDFLSEFRRKSGEEEGLKLLAHVEFHTFADMGVE